VYDGQSAMMRRWSAASTIYEHSVDLLVWFVLFPSNSAHVLMTPHDIVLSSVRNTVSSFSAFVLLVGQQERHPTCELSATHIAQKFNIGSGPNLE